MVGSYVRRTIKSHKIAAIYEKSATPLKVCISKVPPECKKLKNKILRKYADIFKDKLDKTDRVNIPPVKLQIDESRNIQPVHINKPYDVSYHMRKPAKEEFREMIKAGILVPNNEPSDWCSQAFPRLKPGSDPPRCRWVTDFRCLNTALKRPVWGAESSSQVMRHIDPEA